LNRTIEILLKRMSARIYTRRVITTQSFRWWFWSSLVWWSSDNLEGRFNCLLLLPATPRRPSGHDSSWTSVPLRRYVVFEKT